MTAQQAVGDYVALPREKKPLFLMDVAHELTIAARGHYIENDAHAFHAFTGINELQHHLSAEARHLLQDDEKRYPDDVLMNTLIEKADFYGIAGYLVAALENGFRWRK